MTDSNAEESDKDLEDLTDQSRAHLSNIDWTVLHTPVVVRAVGCGLLAVAVLIWSQRTEQILGLLIGVALLFSGLTTLWDAMRSRSWRPLTIVVPVAVVGFGLLLVLSPDRSDVFLAQTLAAVAALGLVRDIVGLFRKRIRRIEGGWVISRAIALGFGAVLLMAFPKQMLSTVLAVTAIAWIAVATVIVSAALRHTRTGIGSMTGADLVREWLRSRPLSMADRRDLYGKILYEGPTAWVRGVRFFVLMTFASIIASMGVITDSTAVVIGAMLIAPLMTPLMAMAMALVMGWPHRLARSAAIAAGGIVLAIALGALLGVAVPAVIDTTSNSQILARSSPTALDLIIAVAAGAAGAFGLSRPDVSDSLPGVAISISLVPPLAVVGIAYSQGDWASGNGALLLFTTNMIAILVVGGLTFVVTGVTPVERVTENQSRVRTAVSAVIALAAIVVGSLLLNGAQLTANLLEQATVEDAVEEWLSDYPDHGAVRVAQVEETVVVTIVGPNQDAPTARSLAASLVERLNRKVTAELRLVVQEKEITTVIPSPKLGD